MKEIKPQEGILVEDTRLTTREAIRHHQESADWPYRDEARFWYAIVDDMDRDFFNGIIYPDGKKVPPPLLAWEDLGNKNTIASYDLFEDEFGLIGKITFNTVHYVDWVEDDGKTIVKKYVRGRYAQGETTLHEYLHLNQQIGRGKDPYMHRKHRHETHNKEWHQMARSFGLNTEGPAGVHILPATPGSVIDLFLRRYGITPPEGAYDIKPDRKTNWASLLIYKDKKEPKGRSTLSKWSCGCQNVRVGTKEFHATCLRCHNVFVKVEDNKQTSGK